MIAPTTRSVMDARPTPTARPQPPASTANAHVQSQSPATKTRSATATSAASKEYVRSDATSPVSAHWVTGAPTADASSSQRPVRRMTTAVVDTPASYCRAKTPDCAPPLVTRRSNVPQGSLVTWECAGTSVLVHVNEIANACPVVASKTAAARGVAKMKSARAAHSAMRKRARARSEARASVVLRLFFVT